MSIQLGDLIAIFMVLWKLTEYMYIFFTYRYECRKALPDVQLIIDSLRQETDASEILKGPPRAIAAGATLAYGEECRFTPESRICSVKWPTLCFVQRKNVPTQRDMAEALILSQKKNHDALQELLQIIAPIHRLIDEHWDERYIRFTNVLGDKHQLLVESCKSPEGFVYYLMSTLRDRSRSWTLLKGAIERGEFWVVDEKDNWDSPHRIGSSPAILADNWEENAIAGRAFRMMIVDSSHPATPDELRLMHSTWSSRVKGSLQEICKLSQWEIENN